MPTQRVTDTAGQMDREVPVVEPEKPGVTSAAAAERMAALVDTKPASASDAGFSTKQTAALERLRRLGSRRVQLRAELEAVDRELLGDAILAAYKLKIPKRLIARESQVVRQTVYNVIERA